MQPLTELCDLIAKKPSELSDKLGWICGLCPSPELLSCGSPRISRSHLNAVLAVSRFLSLCNASTADHHRPKDAVLHFLRSIAASFHPSFWPQCFEIDDISAFYADFLGYICKAGVMSPEFADEVESFFGKVVIYASNDAFCTSSGNTLISRRFLVTLSDSFPRISPSDAHTLINLLMEHVSVVVSPFSPRDGVSTSGMSSYQSSPASISYFQGHENASPVNELSGSTALEMNNLGGSISWKTGVDQMQMGDSAGSIRHHVSNFEQESVESLERQEIALKLMWFLLDHKLDIHPKVKEQLRLVAKCHLQSSPAFLESRKRDWTEHGQLLKRRVNVKLSVLRSAARLMIKSLTSLDSDPKSTKRLLLETLALMIDAAASCLRSVWRKMKICEELFSCLLSVISQVAVARGGQLLRVLLIHLKPLVLTACEQADTQGNSQGAMFESVLRVSCEIIEFGWGKDQAPVNTFILGLANYIREINSEDEGTKEKQAALTVQLNVVRLLADLNVFVKKPEIADRILPLFVERLDGETSIPGVLRLCLLDSVSRLASLGFKKSYRDAVLLLTRSYLNKLPTLGSAESKTVVQEATTEALPAAFLLIARDLAESKLRSDYRHRLLLLCSHVGLAAESRSGRSGPDFLGPLMPAVAEICSDFDPTSEIEPSLLKLFRNLWFYVALFGLAPPIKKNQSQKRAVSTALWDVGSMSTVTLQAVDGPYLWNFQWASAIQQIAQATPPLLFFSAKLLGYVTQATYPVSPRYDT